MKQTGDLNLVKKINTSVVLHFLRNDSPISRSRIAELSGLTKATVSNLIQDLMNNHLVYEIGAGQSSGGRKPMMLIFRQTAGYAIGIDVGVNYIAAALTDLQGEIVDEYRIVHHHSSPEEILALLKQAIHEMIRRAPTSPYGVIGIGIGIPGICDEQGNVLFAPNLGWKDVPLQTWLEAEFQLPIVIDNEANAGALGEKQFSVARAIDHLVYLSMSMGIGAGFIFKGELYRGATGFSGELGHVSIRQDGPACSCGNYGCWELYASEQALLENAKLLIEQQAHQALTPTGATDANLTELSLEYLIDQAEAGNDQVVGLFKQLGHDIGVGLVGVIHSFNPQHIIIGGRLVAAERWIKPTINAVIESRAMTYPRSQLTVEFSRLTTRSTILGACSFVIAKFFASTKITTD